MFHVRESNCGSLLDMYHMFRDLILFFKKTPSVPSGRSARKKVKNPKKAGRNKKQKSNKDSTQNQTNVANDEKMETK
jgi:hypothetical protein